MRARLREPGRLLHARNDRRSPRASSRRSRAARPATSTARCSTASASGTAHHWPMRCRCASRAGSIRCGCRARSLNSARSTREAAQRRRSRSSPTSGWIAAHEAPLLAWLDGPPQTNEAGRSSISWRRCCGWPTRACRRASNVSRSDRRRDQPDDGPLRLRTGRRACRADSPAHGVHARVAWLPAAASGSISPV